MQELTTRNGALSVSAQSELQKAITMEQALFVMARQFPRDEERALSQILDSCSRSKLAEESMYSYPRGKTSVEGPSIRLAETIMQRWGNLDSGWRVLNPEYMKDGYSEILTWCLDRETGSRDCKSFTVRHWREVGNHKDGGYTLTGDRDVYELQANMAARRKRSNILAMIPVDVVEQAIDQCKKTLTYNLKGTPEERIKNMVKSFQENFNVTAAQIEKRYGHRVEALTEYEMVKLRAIYKTLQDRAAKVEDFFESETPDITVQAAEVKSSTENQTTEQAAPTADKDQTTGASAVQEPAPKRSHHKKKDKEEKKPEPNTAPPPTADTASTTTQTSIAEPQAAPEQSDERPTIKFDFGG